MFAPRGIFFTLFLARFACGDDADDFFIYAVLVRSLDFMAFI